mmetsp:Transcript_71263/g.230791  ORF Transcript_71263/g.230791 Transcript_71263/m.230791 type:complete len:247 (-) Transcript_71263:917-1657(-)
MSPKPTLLFSKLSVSTGSSSAPCGLCEGGNAAFRARSSNASSQMRWRMIASTSKADCFIRPSAPGTSSSAASSPSGFMPAAMAASSALRPAKCVMGWSRCTSSRELRGRCFAETSPRSSHGLLFSCSSSSLATSSSRAWRRLSMSYKDLAALPPLSWGPSSSSDPSPSMPASSSPALPLPPSSLPSPSPARPSFALACWRSRIFSSSSFSWSDRSSPSSPSSPSSSSSSAASSTSLPSTSPPLALA